MTTYLCDALHYRDNCMLCGHTLKLQAQIKGAITAVYPNKIVVEAKDNRRIEINFDGYFTRFKMRKSDFQPLTFAMICPLCDRNMGEVKKYGESTLIERLYNQYFYTFDVFADVETGSHFTALNSEFVSYRYEDKLYSIETSFHQKESRLYHGSTLETMLHKKLPIINIKNVETKDNLINKVKLYAVFS